MKLVKNIIILLFLFSIQISLSDNILYAQNTTQFKNYVNDETGTLDQNQINSLNNTLSSFDKTTSNQVIIYIISSLNGESLEDLSITLAEKNKIGKKNKNNGVLLLIVKDDRKIRIEVGYGLEGVLTDAKCSQIIRNEITPEFKSGKYYDGILKGVNSIVAVTKGEYTADKNNREVNSGSCCFGIPIFVMLIFGIIFVFIITSFIRSLFGVGRSISSGKGGWGSGWGGGGFGGGSSGGFSSGGFSGGGGSFGGGGSSGSW